MRFHHVPIHCNYVYTNYKTIHNILHYNLRWYIRGYKYDIICDSFVLLLLLRSWRLCLELSFYITWALLSWSLDTCILPFHLPGLNCCISWQSLLLLTILLNGTNFCGKFFSKKLHFASINFCRLRSFLRVLIFANRQKLSIFLIFQNQNIKNKRNISQQ